MPEGILFIVRVVPYAAFCPDVTRPSISSPDAETLLHTTNRAPSFVSPIKTIRVDFGDFLRKQDAIAVQGQNPDVLLHHWVLDQRALQNVNGL